MTGDAVPLDRVGPARSPDPRVAVIGLVLEPDDGPRIYVSGDNASLSVVRDVHDRFGEIGAAVLHAGAASVPAEVDGRPLSLTAPRVAAAAEVIGAPDGVWTYLARSASSRG